uniref:50S ribosomal protein L35 n=1 Tax=Synarthrophyton chejuense TaxID=2485825 RepID=A0A3G3MG04_9FLOR|nr:ribosomal protein L35 [Synarthrophyton chejuense]AYR05755.1 ribosomal protein L35 [Synarthrophyton chejuense]
MSNYKLKSSSSISKRFKFTSTGKLLRHKACRSHLLQKKSSKRKQQLRKVVLVRRVDSPRLNLNVF